MNHFLHCINNLSHSISFQKSIFALFAVLVFSFFIVGCNTTTIQSTPFEDVQDADSLQPQLGDDKQDATARLSCENECRPDEICANGACACPADKKECNRACIPSSSCCTAKDCRTDETCINNSCTFNCDTLSCGPSATCDPRLKRCACPTDYQWCEFQSVCIPQNHCCSRYDCKTNERCIDTIVSVEICFEKNGIACKIFNTVGQKTITVDEKDYRVNITSIKNLAGTVDLAINGKSSSLIIDQPKTIDTLTVSIKKFRELGGDCRDFDRQI